jgi:Tfp pilus assembly protein PilF
MPSLVASRWLTPTSTPRTGPSSRRGGFGSSTHNVRSALERLTGASAAAAWYEVGRLSWRREDLAGAEEALSRAIELAPADDTGWVLRGRVRLRRGQREAARADLERALQLLPAGDPRAEEVRRLLLQAGGR